VPQVNKNCKGTIIIIIISIYVTFLLGWKGVPTPTIQGCDPECYRDQWEMQVCSEVWWRNAEFTKMLQQVLHRASSRGFTPYYYDLDKLAENAHYHFFATAAAKLIVSIICTQLNLGHLAPCSWEPVVISLNCLLLNINSTKETLLFDCFLIMYNLCVFTCIIVMFVFHCTHVQMSCIKLLLTYLLTYLITKKSH